MEVRNCMQWKSATAMEVRITAMEVRITATRVLRAPKIMCYVRT